MNEWFVFLSPIISAFNVVASLVFMQKVLVKAPMYARFMFGVLMAGQILNVIAGISGEQWSYHASGEFMSGIGIFGVYIWFATHWKKDHLEGYRSYGRRKSDYGARVQK